MGTTDLLPAEVPMRIVPVLAVTLLATPALALEMPGEYIGGWGLSPEACARGERAEGYLNITATELQFYESVGTLQSYETIDEPGLLFEFSFSGEGETWTEPMYLEVQDGGAGLTRIDVGDPGGIPIAYVACK